MNGYDKGVAFTAASVSNNGNQRYQYYPALHINNSDVVANFGQKPFKFPPPDGYQPLNFSNVQPEKVIARPDQYVGVSLWPGNGTSQNITDLKHKPDFVWIKKRAGGSARSHQLFDSVRGVHKTLHSDSTGIEDTNTNRLTAFNQDGFAVGGDDGCNGSSGTFVGWTWKAGGNKNTFNIDDVGYASAAAAGLDGGTITPTGASIGTKQGFSILKYQGNGSAGANISHGLLEAPKLMIHKSLDQSRNWYTIYNDGTSQMQYLYLNLTNNILNSAVSAPTSNVMHFTGSAESNNSGENYIVYMWHDVPGLQKFGTFEEMEVREAS